jgi:hypothetical protein
LENEDVISFVVVIVVVFLAHIVYWLIIYFPCGMESAYCNCQYQPCHVTFECVCQCGRVQQSLQQQKRKQKRAIVKSDLSNRTTGPPTISYNDRVEITLSVSVQLISLHLFHCSMPIVLLLSAMHQQH